MLVETDVIASFISPPIYRLLGVQESPAPSALDRLSVVPNVFCRSTTVHWQISEGGRAILRVFDKTGRAVCTLAESRLDAGSFSQVWDGSGGNGQKLARGTYFIELRTQSRRLTTRALLVD